MRRRILGSRQVLSLQALSLRVRSRQVLRLRVRSRRLQVRSLRRALAGPAPPNPLGPPNPLRPRSAASGRRRRLREAQRAVRGPGPRTAPLPRQQGPPLRPPQRLLPARRRRSAASRLRDPPRGRRVSRPSRPVRTPTLGHRTPGVKARLRVRRDRRRTYRRAGQCREPRATLCPRTAQCRRAQHPPVQTSLAAASSGRRRVVPRAGRLPQGPNRGWPRGDPWSAGDRNAGRRSAPGPRNEVAPSRRLGRESLARRRRGAPPRPRCRVLRPRARSRPPDGRVPPRREVRHANGSRVEDWFPGRRCRTRKPPARHGAGRWGCPHPTARP